MCISLQLIFSLLTFKERLFVNPACLGVHMTYKIKTLLMPCRPEVLLLSHSLFSSVSVARGFKSRPRSFMNSSVLSANSYLFNHFSGEEGASFFSVSQRGISLSPRGEKKGWEVLANTSSLFNRLHYIDCAQKVLFQTFESNIYSKQNLIEAHLCNWLFLLYFQWLG